MPEPPRRLPTVADVERRLSSLEGDNARALGIIGRELGKMNTHIAELVDGLKVRDHMDSQTDLSIHPDRLRLSFRNVTPWAVVAIIAIVALVLVLALR